MSVALFDFSYSDPIGGRRAVRRPLTLFPASTSALVPVLKQEGDHLTVLVPKGAKLATGATLRRVPSEGQDPLRVIAIAEEKKEVQFTRMVVVIDPSPQGPLKGVQLEIDSPRGLSTY